MEISAPSSSSFAPRSVPLSPTASATATVLSVSFASKTIRACSRSVSVNFPITGASSRTTRVCSQFVGPKNSSVIVGAFGSEKQIDENENESESEVERAVALFKSKLQANPRPPAAEFREILDGLHKNKHYSQVVFLYDLMCRSGVFDDLTPYILLGWRSLYMLLGDNDAAMATLEESRKFEGKRRQIQIEIENEKATWDEIYEEYNVESFSELLKKVDYDGFFKLWSRFPGDYVPDVDKMAAFRRRFLASP